MKNYFTYGLLLIFLFSNCAVAEELPMLPITSKNQTAPQNNYNYDNHNDNNFQNYYFNSHECLGYRCWYSTTLMTNELKAIGDAKRKARLEQKCKANKAKKSKCKKLMED